MVPSDAAPLPTTFIDVFLAWTLSFIQMLSHLLNGYLTAFFVFTGIALNLLSVSIFLRKERAGTPAIQYYLVTLTLWQTALLANAFLLYSFPNLWWGHLVSQGTYVYLYPYVYTFANTTHTGSVWIVLTLTIDRYLALCQPLKHRAIGKKRKDHKSNIMLVLVIAKFLVSDILPTVIDVLEHVVGQSAFMRSPLASLFVDISNFLIVLNCSSNFWVFFVWGKRFRRSCRKCIKSTQIGACIYDMAKWNTDSEISLCGAPSSFTTVNVTKAYGSTERSFRFNNNNSKRNLEIVVSRTDDLCSNQM
uniref:G_PROTEIN_RECEP_F1_2 domain-containing protein n=1 Tax=Caenorhabditis japonica TaxID=281687 RepID=A0A8R1HSZ2_CAEJA